MKVPRPRLADLQGVTRLGTDAVLGLVGVVEAMHARITSPPWPATAGTVPAERTRGLTGLVYRGVRGVTHLVGGGAGVLLAGLAPWLDDQVPANPGLQREAILAALNGVLGDHLAASGNPLAITMACRQHGRPLVLERPALASLPGGAGPRLLVLVHGLCMNDLQWSRSGHDHGQALARALGYTPVYVHYDSGLSIATNGRLLADQLEALCRAWPTALERLVLLGHSMGGLVARSAIHQARATLPAGLSWAERLTDLVCLGSPHLGAPLERAGHGVEQLLAALPYAAPLARLGRLRSAGITDLRHGQLLPPPWRPVPLPAGVRCAAIAGRLGDPGSTLRGPLLGDGLVPVASALGQHRDPARRLDFPPERQATLAGTGHLDLLSSPAVFERLHTWLA